MRAGAPLLVCLALAACDLRVQPCGGPALIEFDYVNVPNDPIWAGDTSLVNASLHYANDECDGAVWQSIESSERFVLSSLQPEILTVDDRGRVVGRSPGVATVRAISQGASGEVQVTVVPRMKAIQITAPRHAKVGDTVTVTVEAFDTAGQPIAEPALKPMGLGWVNGLSSHSSLPFLKGATPTRARFVVSAFGTYTITTTARRRDNTDVPRGVWTLTVP